MKTRGEGESLRWHVDIVSAVSVVSLEKRSKLEREVGRQLPEYRYTTTGNHLLVDASLASLNVVYISGTIADEATCAKCRRITDREVDGTINVIAGVCTVLHVLDARLHVTGSFARGG